MHARLQYLDIIHIVILEVFLIIVHFKWATFSAL